MLSKSVSTNYLSHIESGSANKVISLPLLIRISRALDVELGLLVDLSDLDNSKNEIRQQLDEMMNDMNCFDLEDDEEMA